MFGVKEVKMSLDSIRKFIQDKDICWCGDALMLWLEPKYLKKFTNLLGDKYFTEHFVEVSLRANGNVAINLVEHLQRFGINPNDVLKNNKGELVNG